MINFTDILKGKFLEEFAAISIDGMLTAIVLSLILSVFVVFIYRITYAGVNFNRNFAGCRRRQENGIPKAKGNASAVRQTCYRLGHAQRSAQYRRASHYSAGF